MTRPAISLFTLAFLLVGVTAIALSQDTGQITGTVRDSSGANLPNAQVTVTNAATGDKRTTTTNSSGEYLAAGLTPGTYDLEVTAPGFKAYVAKGIILRVAQKARADANLVVGSVKTEVTVQGEGITGVETQSSEVAGTVTAKELTQLNLNGRNFTQLITLVPGVTNQTGLDEGLVGLNGNVEYSVNGGRVEYNNWELDGGDNLDNGSNVTLNVYPSLDAIQEVRVLTSNYGAQYGRSGSGTVEVETKSGTSRFHGDVYEFVRNDIFNARNYFDPPGSVPPYKKNDFGYTFGGPVYLPGHYNTDKTKTFFFWSQEWRRERVPGQTFNQQVPSLAQRSGNFNDVCQSSPSDCPVNPATGSPFPGNIVPINPNGAALLALIPAPNGTSNGFPAFVGSPNQPTNWRQELFRIDHNINSKLRAMFRYAHDSYDSFSPQLLFASNAFPTLQTHINGPGVGMVARLTAVPSTTLVNEFVASYTTDHLILSPAGVFQRPASMTMTGLFNNGFAGMLPGIQLVGGAAYGGGFTEDTGGYQPTVWRNSNPVYTLRDNVSKIIGRHNLQFGGYLVIAQKNEPNVSDVQGFLTFDTSSPLTTGNAFADLLMGNIAAFQQTNQEIKYYNRYKIFEPYFQDDWHITPRLTLNLGLRMSLFGTYRDVSKRSFNWQANAYNPANAPKIDVDGSITGQAGALIPNSGNPFDGLVQCGSPGVPPGCMKGHLFNPAPRVGFAYDLTGKGKTSLRGAYGIFWEHTNGNEANSESLEGTAPLVQTQTQFNIAGYTNIGGAAAGTPLSFPLVVNSIEVQVHWPYVQQWHLDLQHEVARNTVATVSYVGSKGTHLNLQRNLNQVPTLPLSQNPYGPGQSINPNDCGASVINGVPVTGQLANNLAVACGASPDPFRPFQGFGSIIFLSNAASSTYNAFQASLRRTVGTLQLSVAYTWSHAIDNASDRYDSSFVDTTNPQRASSALDQRHVLNISYVYDLPFFRTGGGIAQKVLGGWQWSGITSVQTGTPFSVFTAVNGFNDNAGVGNALTFSSPQSFPDVVGNPNANIPATTTPGEPPLIYNPGAFAAPRGLTFGDAGRNIQRNPRRTNFDMALYKHIKATERATVEFRSEAFNIFNHTQWEPNFAGGVPSALNNTVSCVGANNVAGTPDCLATDNFLRPVSAHRGRTLQFGLKLLF